MAKTRRVKRKPKTAAAARGTNPLSSDGGAITTTHRGTQVQESARIITPKTFVITRGKVAAPLRHLRDDLRRLFEPNTAASLKESKQNTFKDFIHVAGPLGVSHILAISQTDKAPYWRIVKAPHGPTLTFRIDSYALMKDVQGAQRRPRCPTGLFRTAPLVVINNMQNSNHIKLTAVLAQHMFPQIDVAVTKLSQCQRVALFDYDDAKNIISLRHYAITAEPVGISRNLRRLLQRRKIPNMENLAHVGELLTNPNAATVSSESEGELNANDTEVVAELVDDFMRGNKAEHKSAIRLREIGPRMDLELIKVEEGVAEGAVMYHAYVTKTAEEIADLNEKAKIKEETRKRRKSEQAARVEEKQAALISKVQAREERKAKKLEKTIHSGNKVGANGPEATNEDGVNSDAMDRDDYRVEDADSENEEIEEEGDDDGDQG